MSDNGKITQSLADLLFELSSQGAQSKLKAQDEATRAKHNKVQQTLLRWRGKLRPKPHAEE